MTCTDRSICPSRLARAAVVIAAAVLLMASGRAAAHDVPDELVFHAHVAPEAGRLHVPLRVPLVWLVDYDLPKRGPGYLELTDREGLDAALRPAVADLSRDIALFEDGRRLEPRSARWRLSLPSDRTFEDHRDAIANIAGPPLAGDANLFWNQGYLDVHLTYSVDEPTATFAVEVVSHALAERLHLLTTFVAPDGEIRTYDLLGAMGRVQLNPGTGHLLRLFAGAGLVRFLTGWEHVLFVLALALALARRPQAPLRPVVAFGVVVTLLVLATGGSAGVAGLPSTFARLLVSTAAAASLLVVAVGNVAARTLRLRWLTTAACAVPHGLLLAGGLEPLVQFLAPGAVLPLGAYAAGALAGAALTFGAAVGTGWLASRHSGARQRGPSVAALLIGYVGWRDTLERGEILLDVPPPALELGALAHLGRWAAVVLLLLSALWLAFELVAERRKHARVAQPSATAGRGGPASRGHRQGAHR